MENNSVNPQKAPGIMLGNGYHHKSPHENTVKAGIAQSLLESLAKKVSIKAMERVTYQEMSKRKVGDFETEFEALKLKGGKGRRFGANK